MGRVVRYTSGITALLICIAVQAYGQIYTESVVTGIGTGEHHSQSYYMPKMFKMVQSNGNAIIVRLDKELLYSINKDKKEYSQMTFTELEEHMKAMQGKLEAARQEMEKKLAAMPPEQRKIMEQVMGKNLGILTGGGQFDVKKSGETKTISGYACTKYVVTQDGQEALILWTTKDVKEYAAMRRDYEQLAARLAVVMTPLSQGRGGTHTNAWTEAIKVIDGFPIQQEVAGIGMTTVVTKLEKKSIPTSEFEPPAGYRQVAPASLQP